MASANDRLYKTADGRAWVGEHWVGRYPSNAIFYTELPPADDTRWIKGVPHQLDTQYLTLSPFYPDGRLGVCVDLKESKPPFRYPNHPAFAGCRAWMEVDAINWHPVPLYRLTNR